MVFFGANNLYVKIKDFKRDGVYGNIDAAVELHSGGMCIEKKTFTCGTGGVSKTFSFSALDPDEDYAIQFTKASGDGTEITGQFTIYTKIND